jgi:serine/threonine protein kinase
MSTPTPTTIAGRYELQRRLAQGGMAEVWLAIDLTLDRRVAVKWLKPTLATDPIVAERFRREAIAAASLNHPNIVAVHDVFEQDGRQAVVMQLVDGKSLRQLLDTQNRLSPELTCHIGIAVAKALDNAHDAGFVHRDVKPGNIMITPDGRVLLTDFGIAKGLHGDGSDDLTSDNIMMGTAKYLAPEQVRGKKLDGRADLYSLGLVMYECLAGRVPFLGESDADTALARLQRDPTDLTRLRATLPTRLVSAVHALLARKPELRPANGATLIIELEAAQAEGAPAFDETSEERSPVSPFSAGKLVRAASDARGRANDRSRGMRQPTPPRGKLSRGDDKRAAPDKRRRPTAIPEGQRTSPDTPNPDLLASGPIGVLGEPPQITGRVPVQQTPSTRVAVTRADAPPPIHRNDVSPAPAPRDRTPPAGHQRGAPAKGMGQKWGASATVVSGLIALAVVVALILWFTMIAGSGDSSAPASSLPENPAGADDLSTDAELDELVVSDEPIAQAGAEAIVADVSTADDSVAASIAAVSAFDPVSDGGNGEENDDLVSRLTDGDNATAWRTQCYSNQFMGAKLGVGVVVSFDAPLEGNLVVQFANGPYNVDFYAWDGDTSPPTLDGWGEAFDRSFGPEAEMVTASVAGFGATHVLIHLLELGPNDLCSVDNPFSSAISEISIA